MKLSVITILYLLLLVSSGKGQSNEANSEGLLGKYYNKHYKFLKPQLSDSCIIKLDTPYLDSLKTSSLFHQRFNSPISYLNSRPFNNDDMAFDPGTSTDKMPNAVIATPGIRYLLKIFVPGRTQILPYPRRR